jgi:hypothetical protein
MSGGDTDVPAHGRRVALFVAEGLVMFNFEASLDSFLNALFGFLNSFLNSLFDTLADLLGGITIG